MFLLDGGNVEGDFDDKCSGEAAGSLGVVVAEAWCAPLVSVGVGGEAVGVECDSILYRSLPMVLRTCQGIKVMSIITLNPLPNDVSDNTTLPRLRSPTKIVAFKAPPAHMHAQT